MPMWSLGPIDPVVPGVRNITFDFFLVAELINSHLKKNGLNLVTFLPLTIKKALVMQY